MFFIKPMWGAMQILLIVIIMLQLNSRISTSIADKRRQVNYIGIGVTPQAQKLFHAITKTYVICFLCAESCGTIMLESCPVNMFVFECQ